MLKAIITALALALAPDAVPQEPVVAPVVVEVQVEVEMLAGPQAVISGPTETAAGELVILDAGDSSGEGYDWRVEPESLADGRWQLYEDKRVLVFASPVPGRYTFILSVAQDNQSSVAVLHVVNGEAPTPNPFPEPNPTPEPPDPLPKPGKRWVMIFEERNPNQNGRTRVVGDLIKDQKMRKYLIDKGHEFQVVDQTNPPAAFKPYLDLIVKAEIFLPALLIGGLGDSDGKVFWKGPLPATAEELLELLRKWGG